MQQSKTSSKSSSGHIDTFYKPFCVAQKKSHLSQPGKKGAQFLKKEMVESKSLPKDWEEIRILYKEPEIV